MDSENLVQKKLTDMGFLVNKIQESVESRMPDFLAKKDGEQYLIEVKSKFDSEEERTRQKQNYNLNKNHFTSKTFKRNNRISGIISDACDQLQKHPESNDYLRLVWLQASGICDAMQTEEFFYSIYGIVSLNSFSWDGEIPTEFKDCFFFSHSDFYNQREHLDGLIIGKSDVSLLCLNPYSEKYKELKNSALAWAMSPDIIDPNKLEKEGKIYVINCSVDRNNSSLVLEKAKKKIWN